MTHSFSKEIAMGLVRTFIIFWSVSRPGLVFAQPDPTCCYPSCEEGGPVDVIVVVVGI